MTGVQTCALPIYLVSLYYMYKSEAASFYHEALIYEDDLEHSLKALFLWQEHVDLQLDAWKMMNKNNRIEAIMIASGVAK